MTSKYAKTIVRISKETLDQIIEMLFYSEKLDRECISKPLKEDLDDLVNIHNLSIKESELHIPLMEKQRLACMKNPSG